MIEIFFARVRMAPLSVLLTDYDGTLAPFVIDRNAAAPYPGVTEALNGLRRSGRTEIVVVSGRPVAEVTTLLGMDPAPEIWGAHGWECRTANGKKKIFPVPRHVQDVVAFYRDRLLTLTQEDQVEVKPSGVAVHWRGLSPKEQLRLREESLMLLRPTAGCAGLEVLPFDGGMELRFKGRDKGDVVSEVLATRPPGVPVAYLGDDDTDEDAFKALGKRGLTVLVRREYRPTRAELWLRPPEELLSFLQGWTNATR